MSVRVAVASRSFSRHPVLRAEISSRYSVTFNEGGRTLAGQELISFLAGHDRAITALERLDDALFEKLPELKVIGKYGVGLDMVDLGAMARRGIRLGWTPGVNRRDVAELVVAMMIGLLRHLPKSASDIRAGYWTQIVGHRLEGRTVGIVGCGHVGKELAGLLQVFGCTLLAHDVRSFPEFYAAHAIHAVDLDTLLRDSDIITLHVPLSTSTANILDARRLRLVKPTALLINAARGGLVDERTVKAMLKDGQLAGAAFDVFADEPPMDKELLNLPNVMVSPHIGGSTEEAILAMGRAAIDSLETARVPTPDIWETTKP